MNGRRDPDASKVTERCLSIAATDDRSHDQLFIQNPLPEICL